MVISPRKEVTESGPIQHDTATGDKSEAAVIFVFGMFSTPDDRGFFHIEAKKPVFLLYFNRNQINNGGQHLLA